MKVWVVHQADWEDQMPLSVWSTRELAEAELERLTRDGQPYGVSEFTLDESFEESA